MRTAADEIFDGQIKTLTEALRPFFRPRSFTNHIVNNFVVSQDFQLTKYLLNYSFGIKFIQTLTFLEGQLYFVKLFLDPIKVTPLLLVQIF